MRLSGLCLLAGLIGSATAYGGTIDLSGLLVNGNFQSGNQAVKAGDTVGCPIGWQCNPGVGLSPGGVGYQPNEPPPKNYSLDTTIQYNPGANGTLGAGMITPNGGLGTWAGEVPIHEGFGQILQTDFGGQNAALGTYVTGMTYQVDLWVGTPLTVFDLIQSSACGNNPCAGPIAGSITANFLGNNATNLVDPLAGITIAPEPTRGSWYLDTIQYTATAADNGLPIGFSITVQPPGGNTSSNNEVSDFVVLHPGSTPEPGTFALIGVGVISLAYIFRRKLVRNSR